MHREILLDALELSSAAGEHDAPVEDVRRELRRCFLEHVPHRSGDQAQGLIDRLHDLV